MKPVEATGSPGAGSAAADAAPGGESTRARGPVVTPSGIEAGTSDNLPSLIWIFASLLLLLVWAVVFAKIGAERREEIADAQRDLANLARAFEEHTVRTLASLDQTLRFIVHEHRIRGHDLDPALWVREGIVPGRLVTQIGTADETGLIRNSSSSMGKPVSIADREHFQVHVAQDGGDVYVSKPVLGRASGKWSIQMTRRLNKSDGSFAGVAVVSADPTYFADFYRELNLGSFPHAALVGYDGVVRIERSGADDGIGRDANGGEIMKRLSSASEGTYLSDDFPDGVRRIVAYRKVRKHALAVAVGIAERDALAWYNGRRVNYLSGTALFTIVVCICSWGLSRLARRSEEIAREMRLASVRAEEASRLKSEFLASMSHELRTPLNGILGFAECLKDDIEDETQREFAGIIHSSGLHLLTLVNSLLDLAKVEAGRMDLVNAPEDLRALVSEAASTHRAEAERKGLDLIVRLDDALPQTIECDRTRLRQVLNNLLHNAIKFTERGHVSLAVNRVRQGGTDSGGALRFEVRDTGPGIAPEAQDRIFEKFRQADRFVTRKYGGTGLGLALSRQLVELMGGSIGVDSAPGKGTLFWLVVPLREIASPAVSPDAPIPLAKAA